MTTHTPRQMTIELDNLWAGLNTVRIDTGASTPAFDNRLRWRIHQVFGVDVQVSIIHLDDQLGGGDLSVTGFDNDVEVALEVGAIINGVFHDDRAAWIVEA